MTLLLETNQRHSHSYCSWAAWSSPWCYLRSYFAS